MRSEAALLGRAVPSACRAVREALACNGGGAWCVRCGESLRAGTEPPVAVAAGEGPRCADCALRPRFDAFVRLGVYAPPLDALVRRVKERAWHAAAEALAIELSAEVRRRLPPPDGGWLVVPVPASPVRRLLRSIDHAGELAATLSRALPADFVPCLRARVGLRQASLGRDGRLRRRRRFVARSRQVCRVRGRAVLVVDDVRTTGATLNEVRELLILHGARLVVPAVVSVADRSQDQS